MARRDQRTKDTTRSKGKLGDQGKEHEKRQRKKQQGDISLNATIISCKYWSSDDSTNIDECCLSENERKTQINQRVGSWEIREKEIGQINKNQGYWRRIRSRKKERGLKGKVENKSGSRKGGNGRCVVDEEKQRGSYSSCVGEIVTVWKMSKKIRKVSKVTDFGYQAVV